MSQALIDRLTTEFSWPLLTTAAEVEAFTSPPGAHVLFAPGDPARNLETADVAVILPELRQAFQGQFDCAVLSPDIETEIREATGVLKTPSLIFFSAGAQIGGIPRVRDWDEYLSRISQILTQAEAA